MGDSDSGARSLRALRRLGPDELTTQLRLNPTRTFGKGEVVGTGHTGRMHDESGWVVETDPQLGDIIEPHPEWSQLASQLAAEVSSS